MSLFKNNVEALPAISDCYQPGLQGLGTDSKRVSLGNTHKCQGSINLDACLQVMYPHANRWDYIFSYENKVYFVEVHPAQTSEVRTVLNKLYWLKDWLIKQAPSIEKQKAQGCFVWIASGRMAIIPTSPQYRLLIQSGLRPMSTLHL